MNFDDGDAIFITGVLIAILVVAGVAIITQDTTYYDATVVLKHFDYGTGIYYIDFYSSERPSEQIEIRVQSTTYEKIRVGDCKLIQKSTIFGGFPSYYIYGDCP